MNVASSPAGRSGRLLPAWRSVLAVIAHPDDESFGLGAVLGQLAGNGTAVHILCYTRGEASLNEFGAGLGPARETELRQAGAELGVASITLLGYPDGRLASAPAAGLSGHAAALAARAGAGGLLVFDDTGITGHPDHKAATSAAVRAARRAGLPVLAWTLPVAVAIQLRAETGQDFAGQPSDRIDLCVRVSRGRQRRAALQHASQLSPAALFWRRAQLQGECEHLRWLIPPADSLLAAHPADPGPAPSRAR